LKELNDEISMDVLHDLNIRNFYQKNFALIRRNTHFLSAFF